MCAMVSNMVSNTVSVAVEHHNALHSHVDEGSFAVYMFT